MNLSPEWVPYLHERGFETVHWSTIGAYSAPDTEIMQWARDNDCVAFTHDLDFGILLAHSKDSRPSVIQVRTQDVSPGHLGALLVSALRAHSEALESVPCSPSTSPNPEFASCRYEQSTGIAS